MPRIRTLGIAVFILLTVGPLLLGIGYALAYSLGLVGLLSKGVTLEHWQSVLSGAPFWRSIGFSLYVAVVSLAVASTLALAAVLRWRLRLLERSWVYLLYLPLVFPATVVAFLLFQWASAGGLWARLAYQLGLIEDTVQFPDLINDQWGIGIILSHILMATPFLTILFVNIFRSERLELLAETAATLGATNRYIQRRVTLPILLYRARATLILYGIFVLSSYEIPLLLGAQSPQMVSVLTIRKLQRFDLADIPEAYTISVCYLLLILILLSLSPLLSRSRRTKPAAL